MKSLLLVLTMFLITLSTQAQEFKKNYNCLLLTEANGKKGEVKDAKVTFTFFEKNENTLKIVYNNKDLIYKIDNSLKRGVTETGVKYDVIKLINPEDEKDISFLQLFNDEKYGIILLLKNGQSYQFTRD